MRDRINIWVVCVITLIHSGITLGEYQIAVIDFSGDMATFYDPDSILGYIHPVTALQHSFDQLLDLVGTEYVIRDELSIDYFYELPEDITDYNLLYILFGWEGSGEHVLTASEALALEVYLMGGAPCNERAIVVEGNDFCENYGDTSSAHYTYIELMDYFAVTLREPTGTPYYELFGQTGSFAEGMRFDYPHCGTGPGNDPDDIIINEESPFFEYADYLFDIGTKSPARGMQRRGYTPGTAPQAGACVLLPFISGNLQDGEYTKVDLLYRILDFVTVPIAIFTNSWDYDEVEAHSVQPVNILQQDNVDITELRIEYSTDSGTSWNPIYDGDPAEDLGRVHWTVPSTASTDCWLRIVAEDGSGNQTSHATGPFEIMLPFETKDSHRPNRQNLHTFPNPFNSSCNIELPDNFAGIINIFDATGLKVLSKHISSETQCFIWSPNNLPAGIYTVNAGPSSATTLYIP